MSEQAFSINCSDTFNSNIFGEDQSQIIQMVSKSKNLSQVIKKAQEANTHSFRFYKENSEWLMGEVNEYIQTNQRELEQKREEEEKDTIEQEVRNYLYNDEQI